MLPAFSCFLLLAPWVTMYARAHTLMRTHTHTHAHTQAHSWTYTLMHRHTHSCTHTHTHAHSSTHTCTGTHIHHTLMHTHSHSCTGTHTHAHPHACVTGRSSSSPCPPTLPGQILASKGSAAPCCAPAAHGRAAVDGRGAGAVEVELGPSHLPLPARINLRGSPPGGQD